MQALTNDTLILIIKHTFVMIVPIREDVAESIVPWYAHTYSSTRLPIETITAIEEAIPARLPIAIILTSFVLKAITKEEKNQ